MRLVSSTTDYSDCRLLRHAWDRLGVELDPEATVWRYKLRFRCARCGTVRSDAVNAYGEVASRSYDYPDGYRYSEGDEVPSAADLRLRLVETPEDRRRRRAAG